MSGNGTAWLKTAGYVILAVGTLGFGIWRTSQALQTGAPPARPITAPPAAESPSGEGDGVASAPPAPAPAEVPVGSAPAMPAPEADPFIPLPPAPAAPAPSGLPVAVPSGPANVPGEAVPPGRVLDPPELPGPDPAVRVTPVKPSDPPAAPPALPVLAGTLLGNRSSAVFHQGGILRTVPIGESIDGWKVVSVEHGRVTLNGYGRRPTLTPERSAVSGQ